MVLVLILFPSTFSMIGRWYDFVGEEIITVYATKLILFHGILPLLTPTSLHNKLFALLHVLVGYGYFFIFLFFGGGSCGPSPRPPWTPSLHNVALTLSETMVAVCSRKTQLLLFGGKVTNYSSDILLLPINCSCCTCLQPYIVKTALRSCALRLQNIKSKTLRQPLEKNPQTFHGNF